MVHFLVAKLFFIFFTICCINIHAEFPSASIVCAEMGSSRYLKLNYSSDSGLAIFSLHGKWYIVWDLGGPVSDFSLPKQEEWPAGFISIEKAQNIKSSKPCVILSLNLSVEMIPVVIKTEKGWAINAVSEHLIKNDPNPNQVSFDNQGHGYFRIFHAGRASSVMLSMPTGEELNVTPTYHPDAGLAALESGYVDVYESAQGVCLYLKTDQICVERQGKDAVYYPTSEPMLGAKGYLDRRDISPDLTFIRLGDFTSELRFLLATKAIDDKKNRSLYLLKQAWVELALCEGEEAKQTVLLLEKEVPEFTHSLFYQLILGFSQFLSQDYPKSLKTLELLPNTLEVNLWRGLSKIQLGERVLFGEDAVFILQNYPPNLRDYILVKLVPYLFESQQVKLLNLILQTIVPQAEVAKATMAFYYAMYIFAFKDKDEGYKLLEPIAKNETHYIVPNEFQTEARLETYLYNYSDASVDDVIKELDVLRTQSRGDDTEIKICLKLIEQLEKKKDYEKIVEVVQDLVQRFKKFDVSLGLTLLLKSYVEKFFTHENANISPVKIIGLFRKYKTIIEHHPNYEKIAERVVHQYERLDLLDQAADLLTEISKKTLDHEKKIEWHLKIGSIHVKNYKPEQAIELLSETYSAIAEKHQKQAAEILARAHYMKKDHLGTINWLKHHPTKENKRIIADVYISMEDYLGAIGSLKDYLSSLKEKEDNDQKDLGLVQLAAAYYVQKEFLSLKALHDAHKDFMKGRKSDKAFSMLCRPRAEDLKTSNDVRAYINDADVIREIFEKAKVSIG
jgi:hypothetical protein